MQRMAVGAQCERLWREELTKAEDEAIQETTCNVANEWARFRTIPVEKRKEWLESAEFEEYQEDVEDALRLDLGMPDFTEYSTEDINAYIDSLEGYNTSPPPRLITITPKQLKGPKSPRKCIIAKVVKDRGLTKTMVENCWDEFREVTSSPSLKRSKKLLSLINYPASK